MRSGSESIAQLAGALAKAQAELVNPAKTLTGRIECWGTGREGRTYRYAPLSAGLDIVRQTLCRHELAVLQTTHVDRESALVMLTTTLAHGSGEWIAASWPVCRVSDMDHPQTMGAALTYARRYGLFTLVGLAGEDDLDAPASAVRITASEYGVGGQHRPSKAGGRERREAPKQASDADGVTGPTVLLQEPGRAFGENSSVRHDAHHGGCVPAPLVDVTVPDGLPHASVRSVHRTDAPQAPSARPPSVLGLPPQRRTRAARLRRAGAPRRGAPCPRLDPARAPAATNEEEILSLAREALRLRATVTGGDRAALEADILDRLRVLGAGVPTTPNADVPSAISSASARDHHVPEAHLPAM